MEPGHAWRSRFSLQGILACLSAALALATRDLPIANLPVADLAAGEPAVPTRYKPGDFVVVIRRAELKVENDVVDTVDEGLMLGRRSSRRGLGWVTNKKSGWAESQQRDSSQASGRTVQQRNPAKSD